MLKKVCLAGDRQKPHLGRTSELPGAGCDVSFQQAGVSAREIRCGFHVFTDPASHLVEFVECFAR
jgi:hypothetical protein